ncbi:MAG: hypothetical protein ACJA0H_000618 [Francisellaceae bacterium]|jgi:hypothetical protein
MKQLIIGVFLSLLILGKVNASAIPIMPFIDNNVLSYSDNGYTYINGRGNIVNGNSINVEGMALEWLPLDFTTSFSYLEIKTLTSTGGQFDGWRLASSSDMVGLFTTFMGGPIDYNLIDSYININAQVQEWEGAFDAWHPFFRDTRVLFLNEVEPNFSEPQGYGYSIGFFDDSELNLSRSDNNDDAPAFSFNQSSTARGNGAISTEGLGDFISPFTFGDNDTGFGDVGSFLVRDTIHVSAPATLLLMLASLIVLFVRPLKA